MSREDAIAKTAVKMRVFQEPWITSTEAVCALHFIWDRQFRLGITDEDLFLADPDALLALMLWHPLRGKKWLERPSVLEDEGISMDDEIEPSDEPGTAYAVGPALMKNDDPMQSVGQYLFAGSAFKAGPFQSLIEALDYKADIGDCLYQCHPNGIDEIIDVWLPDRTVGGVRSPEGWACAGTRFYLEVMMGQNDKKAATAPKGAATPAAAKPAPGRKAGDPPHFQEGDNVDATRAEVAKQQRGTIFVAVGKTINVGDYESVRIDIGRTVIVEDGKSADEVETETFNAVATAVMSREQEIRDALGQ